MTDTVPPAPQYLDAGPGASIAYHRLAGKSPGVMFCGGFMSDMTGAKALATEALCRRRGQAFVRFDYQGHGASSGNFEDGTIGTWAGDALGVFDRLTEGPQIVVGSSMGGWIALLVALQRIDRVAGLIGIAAAPDFTEDLIWAAASPDKREALQRDGIVREPSAYSETPYGITMALIRDGRKHLLLRGPIDLPCPVRLLHGMLDPDVPWQRSLRLAERLTTPNVRVSLIKDGDHRLSRDADLALLTATVEELLDARA